MSQDILVGHILKLNDNEVVPADLLLLAGNRADTKVCVDSFNNIGEFTLSIKRPIESTQEYFNALEFNRLSGIVKVSEPCSDYEKFKGKLQLKHQYKAEDLSQSNFVPRGTTFKGCPFIIGLVIYAGFDTKLMLNTLLPEKKISKIEKTVNIWVMYLLLVLTTLTALSVGLLITSARYELYGLNTTYTDIELVLIFIAIYNQLIPISLFVVIEIIRVLQVIFFKININKSVKFKTIDANDELGQIDYIVADKTGTITENSIEMTHAVVEKILYVKSFHDKQTEYIETEPVLVKGKECSANQDFSDLKRMIGAGTNRRAEYFARGLAVCNSITAKESEYISSCPYELALVKSGVNLGCRLFNKSPFFCEIFMNEYNSESYEIIHEQPFTKKAKISCILLKSLITENTFLFAKGAYSILIHSFSEESLQQDSLRSYEHTFTDSGVNTMILIYKELSNSQSNAICIKMQQAKHSRVNSDNKIQKLFNEAIVDMTFLGIIGLTEAILPETIEALHLLNKSKIKTWLVSADSDTNLLCSARASKLMKPEIPLLKISKI